MKPVSAARMDWTVLRKTGYLKRSGDEEEP